MAFEERTLTCVECGQSFAFTVEDQEYHAQRGYTNDPKRCPSCRQARRDSNFGGGSYGSSRREMYPVVCAQCGKATQVPFQPRGDRPVYCSDCYSRTAGSTKQRRY